MPGRLRLHDTGPRAGTQLPAPARFPSSGKSSGRPSFPPASTPASLTALTGGSGPPSCPPHAAAAAQPLPGAGPCLSPAQRCRGAAGSGFAMRAQGHCVRAAAAAPRWPNAQGKASSPRRAEQSSTHCPRPRPRSRHEPRARSRPSSSRNRATRPEQSPREKRRLNLGLGTGSSAQTPAPSSRPTGIGLRWVQMPTRPGCPHAGGAPSPAQRAGRTMRGCRGSKPQTLSPQPPAPLGTDTKPWKPLQHRAAGGNPGTRRSVGRGRGAATISHPEPLLAGGRARAQCISSRQELQPRPPRCQPSGSAPCLPPVCGGLVCGTPPPEPLKRAGGTSQSLCRQFAGFGCRGCHI